VSLSQHQDLMSRACPPRARAEEPGRTVTVSYGQHASRPAGQLIRRWRHYSATDFQADSPEDRREPRDPVRAENRIHGSEQQSCSPGAPPVMITRAAVAAEQAAIQVTIFFRRISSCLRSSADIRLTTRACSSAKCLFSAQM
jgi:hypothetical protein